MNVWLHGLRLNGLRKMPYIPPGSKILTPGPVSKVNIEEVPNFECYTTYRFHLDTYQLEAVFHYDIL